MHGHGDKPYLCTYESCDRSQPGNGFPRQWNLKDHMRRVHNDNSAGSGPTSPPAGGASAPAATQASTKGRKRKSDSQETAATTKGSARKSTVKAQAEAAAAAAAKPDPSIAEWHERRQRLEDIIRTLDNPSSARTVQDLEQVSSQAAAMMKISRKLSGPSNRKFSHSSG